MIYRIVGASLNCCPTDPAAEELEPGPMRGAFEAWLAPDEAWSELPGAGSRNERGRCWFTEEGWSRFGRRIAGEARATGRTYRVMRVKNPPRSAVLYRDRWQVVLLPGRHLTKG